MSARLAAYLPFILAVLFPPVGLLLGLIALQESRDAGLRLLVVSVLAAVVWALILL